MIAASRHEDPPPNNRREIAIAVTTAALTTIATGLASWAVDELRARYGTTKSSPTEKDGGSTT